MPLTGQPPPAARSRRGERRRTVTGVRRRRRSRPGPSISTPRPRPSSKRCRASARRPRRRSSATAKRTARSGRSTISIACPRHRRRQARPTARPRDGVTWKPARTVALGARSAVSSPASARDRAGPRCLFVGVAALLGAMVRAGSRRAVACAILACALIGAAMIDRALEAGLRGIGAHGRRSSAGRRSRCAGVLVDDPDGGPFRRSRARPGRRSAPAAHRTVLARRDRRRRAAAASARKPATASCSAGRLEPLGRGRLRRLGRGGARGRPARTRRSAGARAPHRVASRSPTAYATSCCVARGARRRRTRALVAGFLLGDTRGIPDDVVADYRDSGLSHLLAVSGENVAFTLALAGPLLRRLRVGPRTLVALGVGVRVRGDDALRTVGAAGIRDGSGRLARRVRGPARVASGASWRTR